jgi:hypothetical protein
VQDYAPDNDIMSEEGQPLHIRIVGLVSDADALLRTRRPLGDR